MLKLKKQLAERWFVYILRCADGSLYTGIAKDVDRRLEQHNAGTASRYTRSRLPVTLEYQEEQPNQSLALKREVGDQGDVTAEEGIADPIGGVKL